MFGFLWLILWAINKYQQFMANTYILKLFFRAILVVLGLCLMASAVMAQEIPGPHNSSVALFNGGGDFFDGNIFENEPRLVRNTNYSSNQREERERISQYRNLKLDTNLFKGLVHDTRYALTSPWRWNDSDWTTASIVLGVTGGLFLLDDRIQNVVEDNRNSTTDDLSNFFEPFGNAIVSLPALTGLYLYGRLGENHKMERTALLATESFLVTGLFTTVLKIGIGRPRPDKIGSSSDTFDGPFSSNVSLPSGHTSTAFAIATVVAHEYEEVPFLAPISYGIATLTGLSRINDNQHWASDVFLGAALGYFTSKTILRLHSNKKGRHFTIYPRADNKGGGFILSSRF
mgnify:CR=1 FL=1